MLPFLLLIAGTFCVSYFVAAVGPTGGLQLAVTGATVPASHLIPIHAWISAFSAIFRVIGLRDHVRIGFVSRFILPSIAMTTFAVLIGRSAGFVWLKIVIGLYIILNVVGVFRHTQSFFMSRWRPGAISSGLVTGFVTAFIGASGPLLWAFMKERFDVKEELSATHSACLVFQHLSKIVMFGLIGASVFDYWLILLGAICASMIGTLLGQRTLRRFDETVYRRLLNITLLASGVVIVCLGLREGFSL